MSSHKSVLSVSIADSLTYFVHYQMTKFSIISPPANLLAGIYKSKPQLGHENRTQQKATGVSQPLSY